MSQENSCSQVYNVAIVGFDNSILPPSDADAVLCKINKPVSNSHEPWKLPLSIIMHASLCVANPARCCASCSLARSDDLAN